MNQYWTKFVSGVGIALFATLVHADSKREVADRIVAVIENDIITLSELETKSTPFLAQLEEITDAKQKEKKHAEIMAKVLDIEIGEKIVGLEVEKFKDRLAVTEQEVEYAISQVKQMNNVTEQQLQAILYGQGLTWSEYRAKLREQISRSKLMQFTVHSRVQVSDEDVVRRCNERRVSGAKEFQVCASHILLKIPPGADAATVEKIRGQASKLHAELTSGADFAAYALKYSEDKAAPDGSLGCFGKGEMVDAFEEAAYQTDIGQLSRVVRTEFGYHIIKVTDRKAPAAASCERPEDLDPFRNELRQEETERQMNLWLTELKKKAFVDVRL